MSDDASVFVDAGPGEGEYLPVPLMMETGEVYGGMQATKMDVAGTEVLVYQEVDKGYLQECLAPPMFVMSEIVNNIPPPKPDNNIPSPPPPLVNQPPKKKIAPPEQLGKNLQCPICPEILSDDESFAAHFQIHHKSVKKHACFMCDYTTVNRTMFQEHIYMHQGIKPYKCSQCEHRSGSKKNLKKHEQQHPKQNCPNCGHFIKTQYKLKKHIEMCSANDKVESVTMACGRCNVTMKKDVMKNHKCHKKWVRVVTQNLGKKLKSPFVCQICKWSSKSDMKVLLHLIHHPKQKVNEKVIDITILKEHGIMD